MITGHDVSSYQPSAAPRGDFCFTKATERYTYTDAQGVRHDGYVNTRMASQAASARADGQVVGFYHFLHPGNPVEQARFFVATVKPILHDGDLLVCDWEETKVGHASDADKNAFIAEVQRLLPTHMVGLYCNSSDWKTLDRGSHCGDFLWIADYNGKPGRPNITYPWEVHQWTSTPIDTNVARFADRAAMRAWARKKIPGAPKPKKRLSPRANFIAIRDRARAAMLANRPGSPAYRTAQAVLRLIAPFAK